MELVQKKQRNTGLFTFFISGICVISAGVVVSLLQEKYGFAYNMTGTLLSLMSIGNLIAGFATGILPARIGMKGTMAVLTVGYFLGYLAMAFTGNLAVLSLAFFIVGIAKGSTINCCTILVGNNSKDRTKGMNIMHGCYAVGALLCPFLIAGALKTGAGPQIFLSACGFLLWAAFARVPVAEEKRERAKGTDWSFLKSGRFWLLTGLLFFQNATEISVTGWLVTYFKGSGVISGTLSTYTITVMWGATLIARALIAFVIQIKDTCKAMIWMGIFCTIFYIGLLLAKDQWTAIVLLFAFAFAMAGLNPIAVASAGKMTSVTSMGIMLPAASSGAILMPWIIGLVAENFGIGAGMSCNIVSCGGMLLFAVAVKYCSGRSARLPR